MTSKVAIVGLGQRGRGWANAFHQIGWQVTGFDPDPFAAGIPDLTTDWHREPTISASVKGVDWVVIAVPDRIELMRKVIQRAQSEAPEGALILVASPAHEIEDVQGCALRPGYVIRVLDKGHEGFALDVSAKTDDVCCVEAQGVLAQLAAMRGHSKSTPQSVGPADDAETA